MPEDDTYSTGNFEKQGGNEWDIGNGTDNPGSLVINPGGTFDESQGTTITRKAASVPTAALAAGAASLPKVDFTGLKVLAIVAHNGAGACTAAGAAVGDRLIAIFGAPTAGGALAAYKPGTDFEAAVSVVDELQQLSATDLHTVTTIGIFAPAEA